MARPRGQTDPDPEPGEQARAGQVRRPGEYRDYLHRSPEPADIALVVEISDSSLSEDRKQAVIYAAAGIPNYWIVNLVDRQVEVYSNPSPAGYESRQDYHAGDSIPLKIEGGLIGPVAVSDFLP